VLQRDRPECLRLNATFLELNRSPCSFTSMPSKSLPSFWRAALSLVVRSAQHRDAVRLAAGDLDPHASVPDHDGDRDRFPRHGRAAVEQTVGHHLAGQENRDVTARVQRAKQTPHERTRLPHLIGPARERRTLPNRRPSHPRTHPSPAVRPRTPQGSNQTQGNARSTQPPTSSRTHPPDWVPAGHARARSGRAASTHTAPWPEFPSAVCPWTPQHPALQRYKVTHTGTEQKRPASARIRS
jgi:hypothetical protein